jgi:hypothetical protein
MSSRAAEFASAILIGVLVGVFAGAYLITMPYAASDDCLTQPTGDTPQGQHWFYRVERGSKRHCWYLRAEADTPSRAASSDKSSKSASRKQDSASQHSISDARAELRSRARIEDNTSAVAAHRSVSSVLANATAAVADDNGAGSNAISRWPDPVGVIAPATPQPDTAAKTIVADAQQQPDAVPAVLSPATAGPAAAATPAPDQEEAVAPAANASGKYSGSLQELMVVAFAALALAGLTGSGVYRLAGAGRARRRYKAERRSTDWQRPKKNKKARKARRVEPQPVAANVESFAPESFAPKPKSAPEPAHPPVPAHQPEPAYEPEPDYARAPEPRYEPEPEYASEHEYASDQDYASTEPEYEPEPEEHMPQPGYAPRPQYAPQYSYANAAHSDDYQGYEPVSEYAPKPRARGVQSRELNESFESIEQLLIRLAK